MTRGWTGTGSAGPAGWTSWALSRLDLGPAALAERVLHLSRLPDTPEGREVVDLHLASLDVSLDVGSPDLLVPQLRWEIARWHQVCNGPRAASVWQAVHSLLADSLDELTLAAVVRHVGAADATATAEESRVWAQRGRGGLSGLTGHVQTYLGHAVAGRHEQAIEHVLGLVDQGTPVSEVLTEVVASAQHELGRLWERGVVNVAQEHIATAVTQITLSSLHPRLCDAPRLGTTLVAATTPGDQHEVGLRIATDLLHLRGWDTRYVGASCPVEDVIDAVVRSEATLLLLGASMTSHLPGLQRAVESVRADPRCDGVTVMVGGDPFRHAPTLVEWVGADLVATSGAEAVAAADGLVPAHEATGV
jgi:methanogenic corrinoid protein MtbC1